MSVTLIIIIVTVAISLAAFNNANIFQKGLMNPYMVFHKHQFFRLVTSGFLHGSYIHLGFNMFTFYFFGMVVEQVFGQLLGDSGTIVYVIFYLSAIIISDLPVAYKKRDDPMYNSLGASGAVSAMVFASILYFPLNDICLYAILCIPGFLLGALYVIYSYYQGKNMSDNINHEAHLYGAIYGLIFALIVYPEAGGSFIEQILSYRPFG
ncbi:rhomboid family intramembrane serine protease [Marinoscillum sp. MHG1-6]|uniref:rhomboid family intramembrane serine protease n=1 Tax=Marinoscillum sp. MHG1-6 TaxID=2959627 RepID=UPI0021572A36|nr:rhomboid family intramembrane serine protease [Marinoscillum sp. MHG1-6]